jgi:hypothetical protein
VTQAICKTLDSNAIKIVGNAVAGILVLVWLFVFSTMLRALLSKRLLWPEEDGKDHAFRTPKDTRVYHSNHRRQM